MRALRWLVHVVIGPLALTALGLAALRPADASWALALALSGAWAAGVLLARSASRAPWALGLCSVAVFLWPEMGLRAIGYRYEHAGTILLGEFLPEGTISARRHPELFWTLPPEEPGVNEHGFMERDFEIPKPTGVYRIVFLGDSCTQQGIPAMAKSELARRGVEVEALNLGVAGYSSFQGRSVAERWTGPLEPDLAVVYFGWNDHWQAYGYTDAERARGPTHAASRLLAASRGLQLAVRLIGPRRPQPLGRPRVSLDEYRANLEAIGRRVERAGGELLLLTAPSAHGRRGVPEYLVAQGFAASKAQVLDRHRRYNEAVRDLARGHGWALLDLAEEARSLAPLDAYFLDDGIHFTRKGLRWVGRRIAQRVSAIPREHAHPYNDPHATGEGP